MKWQKWLVAFLVIWLIVTSVFANDEGKVKETILDNGLKVLTVEMHTAPIIFAQISYKVGSRNENFGITGISHLTEHMMFKGTPTYPKGMISRLIKKNGGVFNAFTSENMTGYYEQLPANQLELALAVESDRMHNCVFNEQDFRLEREVVKEERRMRTEDNPGGILQEELKSIAFKSHPYHNPIIGWMSDLNAITRDQVYQYYQTYYTPNNAILVLVGDFETDHVLKLVRKYYGKIQQGPPVPAVISVEEPQVSRREVTVKREDQKTVCLVLSFHVPAMGHPDLAPLSVAASIFSSGPTSRLYKLLVEEKELAFSVRANAARSIDPDLFQISVNLLAGKDDKLPEVEALIFQEITRLQQEPISDFELQKVQNNLKYQEIVRNQKVSAIASRLSTYETYYSWRYIDDWNKQLDLVAKEDIQRVMQKYFSPAGVTVAYLLPVKSDSLRQEITNRLSIAVSPLDSIESDLTDTTSNFISEIDYRDLEKEIIRPHPVANRVVQGQLSNGIRYYLIEDHLFPEFSINGLIETGNLVEEAKKPSTAALFGRMMNRGTRFKTYQQLSEMKSFFPISFSFSAGNGQIAFAGSGLIKNVDTLLAIGREMLLYPQFRQEDLQNQQKKMITVLQRAEGGTGWQTSRFLFQTVYSGHPYGVFNTIASIQSVTIDDLYAFHKKYIRPETMSMVVLGDFNQAEMKIKLEKAFGNFGNSLPFVGSDFPEVKAFTGKVVKVIPMPEKKQVDVRFGFSWVRQGHPDENALDLLNQILGGSSLTSRLGVAIRDQQGLAYSVSSVVRQKEKGGIWFAEAKTEAQNLPRLLATLIAEIERIKYNGVTKQELQDAQAYYLSMLPMMIETPHDIGKMVYNLVRNKRSLDYFDTYFDQILSVKLADVNRVAKQYLSTDNYVLVVAGPVAENALDGYK